jgi:hypothetical protein
MPCAGAAKCGARDDSSHGTIPSVTISRRGRRRRRRSSARGIALGEAALDDAPLVGGQDARHEVERERPVAALGAVGSAASKVMPCWTKIASRRSPAD